MLFRLTHTIDQAAEDIPPLLWSRAAVGQMKSVVERFPEIQARTIGPARLGVIGLEFRLAPGAEQVDLTFPILSEDRDVIVNLGRDPKHGSWLREEPMWQRIWQLCCRWADETTLLGRHVKLLWLELDVNHETGAEGTLPAPGIFVGFTPQTTVEASHETWRRMLSDVLSLLTGQAPQPALLGHFERCLRALPEGAVVQYAGLMLSRGGDTVRFVFADVAEPDLPAFLSTIGWPERADDLLEKLRAVTTSPEGERLHRGASTLQVDIGPAGILPRIGLEYQLDRSRQVERGIEERSFLERLVARSLCSAEKLEALLELPGRTLSTWRDLCLVGHSRQVHHVKLIIDSAGLSEAKAYYGQALAIQRIQDEAQTA